jgi:hypothetical protein
MRGPDYPPVESPALVMLTVSIDAEPSAEAAE